LEAVLVLPITSKLKNYWAIEYYGASAICRTSTKESFSSNLSPNSLSRSKETKQKAKLSSRA